MNTPRLLCFSLDVPGLCSLWDIVNNFALSQLAIALAHLEGVEVRLHDAVFVVLPPGQMPERKPMDENVKVGAVQLGWISRILNWLADACSEIGLSNSREQILNHYGYFHEPKSAPSCEAAHAVIHSIRVTVIRELLKRRFLWIAPDRSDFVDQDELFGESVGDAFPSACQDIKEAGNCLAAECNIAAVFHLMRAAEYGLRALAYDRRIPLPKKTPLDLATWDEVIRKLEDAEQAIQGYPKTLARETQLEFYHGAMMEFKRFKNKFRNRIMHARGYYDRDQAFSAFNHVRQFMVILATRISETRRTPTIWKGRKWINK